MPALYVYTLLNFYQQNRRKIMSNGPGNKTKICPLLSIMQQVPVTYTNPPATGAKDTFVDCQKEKCQWYHFEDTGPGKRTGWCVIERIEAI
jgi:hypothetical protein